MFTVDRSGWVTFWLSRPASLSHVVAQEMAESGHRMEWKCPAWPRTPPYPQKQAERSRGVMMEALEDDSGTTWKLFRQTGSKH